MALDRHRFRIMLVCIPGGLVARPLRCVLLGRITEPCALVLQMRPAYWPIPAVCGGHIAKPSWNGWTERDGDAVGGCSWVGTKNHVLWVRGRKGQFSKDTTEQLDVPIRPVVGQLSEVVPFLLLEQMCGMACQPIVGRQAALPTLFGEETLPDVHICSE